MNVKYDIKRKDLLFQELSFKINGILFDVSNKLGAGHKEKYYEKAISIALSEAGLKFTEQKYVPLTYNDKIIGKYFLDFLIEDKIVLELKQGKFVSPHIIKQTKHYLSALNLQLALMACFTYNGVIIKRIINIPNQHS
jgi:GxxExxY protein